MAGRGTTTFQKRQKEMQRKERQQEKFAKRMERKTQANTERPLNEDDSQLVPSQPDAPSTVVPCE